MATIPAFFIIGVVSSLFLLNGQGKVTSVATSVPRPATAFVTTLAPAPKENKTEAKTQDPAVIPSTTCRILSWNLRDCAATNSKTGERLSFHGPIAEVLAGLKPDIAVFEEIQRDDKKGGDIALLQVALSKAGWAMPYQVSIETGGPDDIALFSRDPILSFEAVLKPGPSDPWPRPGLHAVVAQKAKLDIFVFHFKAMSDKDSESARKAQAKAVADLVRKKIENKTISSIAIIAGDFNTTNPGDRGSPASTLGFLELRDDTDPTNDFKDVIEDMNPQVPTFVDKRYRSILDHLILSPKATAVLKPGSALVYEDLPAARPIPVSDHRPVLVDLLLNAEN